MAETETIYVIARPELGQRTALWEINEQHPDGEVYIDGATPGPVAVARTAAVVDRLSPRDGTLIEVSGRALDRAREAAQTEQERVETARAEARAQEEADREDARQRLAGAEAKIAELEGRLALLAAPEEAVTADTAQGRASGQETADEGAAKQTKAR